MKEIFIELVNFSGADYGVIYDSDKEKISFSHKWEFPLETKQRIIKLLKRVAELQKEEKCLDVEKRPLFKNMGIKGSFICSPLEKDGNIPGAVFLGSLSGKDLFSEQIEKQIRILANAFFAMKKSKIVEEPTSFTTIHAAEQRYLTMGLRFGKQKIVGIDPVMEENVFTYIEKFKSENCSPVLIYGESGTGKELVAGALHYKSERKEQVYLPINCAELAGDPGLQRSELFGCVEGVATSVKARKGKLELAHRGTIFFDEIGSLSQTAQGLLLRFLESKKLEPVGASKSIDIDIRIVCANNRPLYQLVKEGTFREDLFYRLSSFIINIPPLRERSHSDIKLLANYFLGELNHKTKQSRKISSCALQKLYQYHWPGNVRQLRKVIQRSFFHVSSSQAEIQEQEIEKSLKDMHWEEPQKKSLSLYHWIEEALEQGKTLGNMQEEIKIAALKILSQKAATDPKLTRKRATEILGIGKNLSETLRSYGIEWGSE